MIESFIEILELTLFVFLVFIVNRKTLIRFDQKLVITTIYTLSILFVYASII